MCLPSGELQPPVSLHALGRGGFCAALGHLCCVVHVSLCWGCVGQPFSRESVTDRACVQLPVEEAPVRGQRTLRKREGWHYLEKAIEMGKRGRVGGQKQSDGRPPMTIESIPVLGFHLTYVCPFSCGASCQLEFC